MGRWIGFAGLAALLLACVAGCVSEEIYESDISVETLEQRKDKAMDPEGRYAQAKSCIIRQRITALDFWGAPEETMVELKFQNPDKFRLTSYSENSPVSALISDGNSAWQVDYKKRRIMPQKREDLELSRDLARLADPHGRLKEVFEEVKIDGCRIGDEDYYKLSCSAPRFGVTVYIYVDRSDYLIKRIRIGDYTDSKVVAYTLYEGVKIADEMEVEKISDGSISRSKVIFYKLDVPLDPSDFWPPIFNEGVGDAAKNEM